MSFTLRTTDEALNAVIYSCVLKTLGFKVKDKEIIFSDDGVIPDGDYKLNIISPNRSALVVVSECAVISLSFMNHLEPSKELSHMEVKDENSNK